MTEGKQRMQVLPRGVDTPETLRPRIVDEHGISNYVDVEVAAPLGFRPLRMDVMVPPAAGRSVPVVAYIHGGAFMVGSRRHGSASTSIWNALLQRRIAVATVEYRLSGEALFPACLHDVKAAIRWLRRFGPAIGLDDTAIGTWGKSAGAHLATFLALNNAGDALNGQEGVTAVSSAVQAAVAWYPPTQFRSMDAQAPTDATMSHDAPDSPESRLVGGAIQEHREMADFASPVTHVGTCTAPILLVHGLLDRTVPHRQSVVMKEALDAAGADATLELVPDADHGFEGVDVVPLIERSANFLAERLLP